MQRPQQKGIRLQKFLADRGISSRRKIEVWIEQGKIRVDGRVAQPGDRVTRHSRISIDGKPLRGNTGPRVTRILVYNKPEGEISTRDDPGKRDTVFRRLPRLRVARWVVVGRLDINTRGLLLFTNNGDVANRLMHPEFGLEREYLCRVFGNVSDNDLERLRGGVMLDDQMVNFKEVRRQRGEGRNTWFSVVVTEGKYREVRRLWQSVGCQLSRLVRVRYGNIVLPKGLRQGEWAELKSIQISRLLKQENHPDREAQAADLSDIARQDQTRRISPGGRSSQDRSGRRHKKQARRR